MSQLYKDLAEVYEAMYQTFIDYEDEYHFYNNILIEYSSKDVLEIGSGTGNLAPYFELNDYKYLGLDYSKEMIAIANKKSPNCKFIQGDMRNFDLEKPVSNVIITGRTISYIITNSDVNTTFASIHRNLKKGGILCFDFIDANRFIPAIANEGELVHKAPVGDTTYVRKSNWKIMLAEGMDCNWQSTYFMKKGDELEKIGEDEALVRTFTQNELDVFLRISGFRVIEWIERANYTFPTLVVVAQKIT